MSKLEKLRLELIEAKIELVLSNQEKIMATLQELQTQVTALDAKVTAESDVIASAITLLNGLHQMLTDALAQSTPQAVVDQVKNIAALVGQKSSDLADAVAANTPAAP